MKVTVDPDTRVLTVQSAPGKPHVHVYPSSETGQLSSGTKRVSKTWRFELEGRKFRVQLQEMAP